MANNPDGPEQNGAPKTINEADFQASIVAQIRDALPLLNGNIRVERYLHLKLGHHDITINGSSSDKRAVKGRSDVVVYVDDTPLLLAELKAPDVSITSEDLAQGLSYARLHRPMVPLVLVTNGLPTATHLICTYDGAPVSTEQADAAGLLKLMASASKLAAEAVQGAIRALLGSDPVVWHEILQRWNNAGIESRTGPVNDFRRPIAENFQVPRKAVDDVANCLADGAAVIVLHGPPLSGVTCAMTQLAQALPGSSCIYIDARSVGDVLQFIANKLSRELSAGISKDDLRQWLNTGQALPGLTLMIDGSPLGALEELLDLAEAGLLKIVFGLDSWVFKSLMTQPSRPEETTLARLARVFELADFSKAEFEDAREVILKNFDAAFLSGAEFVADLRVPRTLRMLVSQIPARNRRQTDTSESGDDLVTVYAIPPIPTYHTLERASAIFAADPKLKHDLSRLASAFLEDVIENGTDPERVVETFGAPSIDPTLLEANLGESRFERLSNHGIIHWTDTRTLGPRLVVRLPELLAHHISVQWSGDLRKVKTDEELVEKLKDILRLSNFIPYGDLCVAAAIARIKNGATFHVIAEALLNLAPKETRLKEGSIIELLTADIKGIRIHFGEGMDERLPGDMQPWLVLSHLASIRADFGESSCSFSAAVFAGIGDSKDLIFKPPPEKLSEISGFHFHDVPGVGLLPCAASGIIEPLLQAMYFHALWRPEEFKQLVEIAIAEKMVYLAWRLSLVTKIVRSSTDRTASESAMRADTVLNEWWQKTFDAAISH